MRRSTSSRSGSPTCSGPSPGEGFVGANVTIPHKLRALEAADEPTEVARAVGAANTLTFEGGRIDADNTDVEGFLAALRERAPEAPGGHARAGAGRRGRRARRRLRAAERRRSTGGRLEPAPGARARAGRRRLAGPAARPLCKATEPPLTASVDLLVNATSVGMRTHGKAPNRGREHEFFKAVPLSADELGDRQIVVDLVYRPGPHSAVARRTGPRSCVAWTDSTSWSTKERRASGSGPGWRRRSGL